MVKKFVAVAALAVGLAWAQPASAIDITFDVDGGGSASGQTIKSLDWNVGNAIVATPLLATPGTPFQLYYQANLNAANIEGGGTVSNGSGTGATYITLVLGYREQLTGTPSYDPGTGQLTANVNFVAGPVNFFQIYANTVAGSDLTGSCFVCGSVVMSGSIVSGSSSFQIDNATPVDPTDLTKGFTFATQVLDQSGIPGSSDNYAAGNGGAGVQTVTGGGFVNLTASIDPGYNTAYFQGLGGSLITFALATSNTHLPFEETDPSACFFASSVTFNTGTNATCTGTGGSTGVSPFRGVGNVGLVNGLGTNTMFQTDANATFRTVPAAVPEPATLTLLGVGLLGTAAARRRAKKAAKK